MSRYFLTNFDMVEEFMDAFGQDVDMKSWRQQWKKNIL